MISIIQNCIEQTFNLVLFYFQKYKLTLQNVKIKSLEIPPLNISGQIYYFLTVLLMLTHTTNSSQKRNISPQPLRNAERNVLSQNSDRYVSASKSAKLFEDSLRKPSQKGTPNKESRQNSLKKSLNFAKNQHSEGKNKQLKFFVDITRKIKTFKCPFQIVVQECDPNIISHEKPLKGGKKQMNLIEQPQKIQQQRSSQNEQYHFSQKQNIKESNEFLSYQQLNENILQKSLVHYEHQDGCDKSCILQNTQRNNFQCFIKNVDKLLKLQNQNISQENADSQNFQKQSSFEIQSQNIQKDQSKQQNDPYSSNSLSSKSNSLSHLNRLKTKKQKKTIKRRQKQKKAMKIHQKMSFMNEFIEQLRDKKEKEMFNRKSLVQAISQHLHEQKFHRLRNELKRLL